MAPTVTAQSPFSRWEEFQDRLQGRVNPVAWQTWIEPLQPSIDDSSLTLIAPSDFHRRWVADRYLGVIEQVAVAVYGEDVVVSLTAGDNITRLDDSEPMITIDDRSRPAGRATSATPPPGALPPLSRDLSSLIAKYTFDNFVVGPSNRFAHAAAMAVGEQASSHYNPLFIYGPAGLGKTHLLHAVGHLAIEGLVRRQQ